MQKSFISLKILSLTIDALRYMRSDTAKNEVYSLEGLLHPLREATKRLLIEKSFVVTSCEMTKQEN